MLTEEQIEERLLELDGNLVRWQRDLQQLRNSLHSGPSGKLVAALLEISRNAPEAEDFESGGKYDYDNDCGNTDDVARKAEQQEHFRLAQIARRALSAQEGE